MRGRHVCDEACGIFFDLGCPLEKILPSPIDHLAEVAGKMAAHARVKSLLDNMRLATREDLAEMLAILRRSDVDVRTVLSDSEWEWRWYPVEE